MRGLGEPVATFGNQLVPLLAEENHILSDEVRFDLREINRYFHQHSITHS